MSSPDPVPGPRAHVSSPDCWCRPTEVEPGVWVHGDKPPLDALTRAIGYHHPAGSPDIHLHVEAYVPDLKGAIEGDDAL